MLLHRFSSSILEINFAISWINNELNPKPKCFCFGQLTNISKEHTWGLNIPAFILKEAVNYTLLFKNIPEIKS